MTTSDLVSSKIHQDVPPEDICMQWNIHLTEGIPFADDHQHRLCSGLPALFFQTFHRSAESQGLHLSGLPTSSFILFCFFPAPLYEITRFARIYIVCVCVWHTNLSVVCVSWQHKHALTCTAGSLLWRCQRAVSSKAVTQCICRMLQGSLKAFLIIWLTKLSESKSRCRWGFLFSFPILQPCWPCFFLTMISERFRNGNRVTMPINSLIWFKGALVSKPVTSTLFVGADTRPFWLVACFQHFLSFEQKPRTLQGVFSPPFFSCKTIIGVPLVNQLCLTSSC